MARLVKKPTKKIKVRAASYSPPIPDRIGDQYQQRSARKRQWASQRFRQQHGTDGGVGNIPSNPRPAPVDPWTEKDRWRYGDEGLVGRNNNLGRRNPKRRYRY
jgi:hypothetical protein